MPAFTYVVVHDNGFAPNPYHGWCTLACCKPRIRETARPGDLVMGLSSRSERIVYVMRVDERLTFDEYWSHARFLGKRPTWTSRTPVERIGDNIYAPVDEGGYAQQRSAHWDHENRREHEGNKVRDLSSEYVLVAREFAYFGGDGPALPDELAFAKVTRGHRSQFTSAQLKALDRFFERMPRGVVGRPGGWPFAEPAPLGPIVGGAGQGPAATTCSG